jgi:hypothetical protein
MHTYTKIAYVICIIGVLTLPGCSVFAEQPLHVRDPATITEAEARAVLQQAEAYARSGDIHSLCAMYELASLRCERQIKELGGLGSVPQVSPIITKQHIIPNQDNFVGGRLLVVEGHDNAGKPYRTDVLIFDGGGGKLVPLEPVYWSGMGFAMPHPDGTLSTSPPPLPPPVSP